MSLTCCAHLPNCLRVIPIAFGASAKTPETTQKKKNIKCNISLKYYSFKILMRAQSKGPLLRRFQFLFHSFKELKIGNSRKLFLVCFRNGGTNKDLRQYVGWQYYLKLKI